MQQRFSLLLGFVLLVSSLSACSGNAKQNEAKNTKPNGSEQTAAKPIANEPGRIYLANQQLSILPPDGFTPMPAEEVAKKYPGSSAPLQVLTNGDRTAVITITLTQQPMSLSQLPELKPLMSKRLEKTVPGLKWIAKDLIAINGGSWMKMEAISKNKKEHLHNDMYFTALNDRMLGINFSAQADQFPKLKVAFTKSRDSIQVMGM
jgi:hypothetical protein